jgi:hypothetical protein
MEQLLFLALIVLFWGATALANFLRARAAQREQAGRREGEEVEEEIPPFPRVPAPARPAPEPPPRIPAPAPPPMPAPPRVRVVTPPPLAPAPARRERPAPLPAAAAQQPARFHLGDLADVRRGIVLMTILGPCRGLEQDDRWQPGR